MASNAGAAPATPTDMITPSVPSPAAVFLGGTPGTPPDVFPDPFPPPGPDPDGPGFPDPDPDPAPLDPIPNPAPVN